MSAPHAAVAVANDLLRVGWVHVASDFAEEVEPIVDFMQRPIQRLTARVAAAATVTFHEFL